MRKAVVRAATAAAATIGLLSGCSVTSTPEATSARSSFSARETAISASRLAVSASPANALSPKEICQEALGPAALLDWAPGTVAQFRTYQYGGPKATVPLRHAFPGVPEGTRGAWCGTSGRPQSTHWWAVVVGHKAASVITTNGPGEGVRHGSVPRPPLVP